MILPKILLKESSQSEVVISYIKLHLNRNAGSSLKEGRPHPVLTDWSNGTQVSQFCLKCQQIWVSTARHCDPSVKKTKRKDQISGKLFCAAMETRDFTKGEHRARKTQGQDKHMETTLKPTHTDLHTNTCRQLYKSVEQLFYEMKGEYFMSDGAKCRLQLPGCC